MANVGCINGIQPLPCQGLTLEGNYVIPIYPIAQPYPGPSQYLSSPSGAYYAGVGSSGQFFVSRGSDPITSGSNIVWASPTVPSFDPETGYAVASADGSLYIVPNGQTNVPAYTIHGDDYSILNANFTVGDNGAFTIKSGAILDQGKQLFSNNFNDPIVTLNLSGLTYDLSNPIIGTSSPVTGGTFKQSNETSVTQQYPVSLTLSYTKTSSWDWQLSEAVTLGTKSTVSVGVPGLGQATGEISLSETTTISGGKGESDTENKSFSSGGDITVPPLSTYQTTLTGTAESYSVPFTYDGLAHYRSGATVTVRGSGVFNGTDTGIFTTVTTCISTPSGCPAPPGFEVPVPEPASLSLLPAALLAAAAMRRLRAPPSVVPGSLVASRTGPT